MSSCSSPVNGYEAANLEPAMRLSVRKDLFPDEHLSSQASGDLDSSAEDDFENVSCVKLETDFEQSIDDIAQQKQKVANGVLPPLTKPKHRKHKQHSRHKTESTLNGELPKRKRKKSSHREHRTQPLSILKVKGGKNLSLVSSSECQEEEMEEEEDLEKSESSEDEVFSVKLPLINVPRQSGKPYSHELSQLSTKKSKTKDSRERRTHSVIPCSGKPRSMMTICSSRSKKKSKKSDCSATYRSQIVDTNTIKIKIRKTNFHEPVTPLPIPAPTSISNIALRKSKKKRAASPVDSISSGEEFRPDKEGPMSVGAPKSRNSKTKTARKLTISKSKKKCCKTEKTEKNSCASKDAGPQSPWAQSMPIDCLIKIFEIVVAAQGTLPAVIRLGKVCKLWHSVSCRPELWRHVDLSSHVIEKFKTDYKLAWLLENRLSKCQSLNIAQWKVCNVSWVLACVVDYCPDLVELSIAGWSPVTAEQLFELVQGLNKLQRLDLSLASETGGMSTCLSAASMARVAENFGARFTHLTLANNKFTALPQILSSVAAHCPNLEVLDISGAQATSHPAAVPLEALQKGCPKIRVFRAANSQLVLAHATTAQQMESGGWTELEELSIAGEAASSSGSVTVGKYCLGDDDLGRLVRTAMKLKLLDLRGLQRLTDSGLVKVPAWELQHLFLGGCNVTRKSSACLELICEKWSHSLIELDLSWASAGRVLDDAVRALADAPQSCLKILNLCGSSVSLEPVKKVLLKCQSLESLNLSACRALPRGMKRLYTGKEIQDLKDSLDPEKVKAKEAEQKAGSKKKKDAKKTEADSKFEAKSPNRDQIESSSSKQDFKSQDKSSPSVFQEPKILSDSVTSVFDRDQLTKSSPDSKDSRSGAEGKHSRDTTPKLLSPAAQSKPDSSSTPRSESKPELGSPHFSPLTKPDSQLHNSPEVQSESVKSNSSWNLGQFKTTPTHKSEASPLNRIEGHKLKHGKAIEQCSPTTSLENKPSPETVGLKQDIKTTGYYGSYSPMPRQENQFSSQRSPYSAQPSPAQPSPYSTQPSPYSTQPSPYSSQPSPYSAQPSPDTSQMVKADLQKSGTWNSGNYSPMPKHPQPYSPHPATLASPDPGLGVKSNPGKTPGQYSPMSRQDRLHQGPYSPRPSVDVGYGNKKSPGVGSYAHHLPSPEAARRQDSFRALPKQLPEPPPLPDIGSWGAADRFNQPQNAPAAASLDAAPWGSSFGSETRPRADPLPGMLNTPQPQWGVLPPFDSRRGNSDMSDPWSLGQFRVEPPHQVHNTFVEQSVAFDSLSAHLGHPAAHVLQKYLDENFTETSRVD